MPAKLLERDEFERLLAEPPDDLIRPLVTLACWIGFRRGELLKLEWRQVDLDKGTIRLGVGTTKNKDGRLVYLPAEALEALGVARAHEHGRAGEGEDHRPSLPPQRRAGGLLPVQSLAHGLPESGHPRPAPARLPPDDGAELPAER